MAVCKKVQQHRERLDKLYSNPEYYLDEEELERIKGFFTKNIFHWKAPFDGQPFELEEWQINDLVKPLLTLKRKSDDTRVFRTAYIQLPRKNGKSSLTAALLLYILLTQGNGLEIYTAATKKDQSKIVFNDAVNFIRASAPLKKRLNVYKSHIEYPKKASILKPLSADYNSMDGLNASALCLDEVHKMKRDIHDVLVTSTGSRKDPLVIKITTAGDNEFSVCYDEYNYSSKILEGIIEADDYFCLIYEADKELEWNDPEAYRMANPNIGVSISEDYLERELKKAEQIQSYRSSYQRYHLNRWVQASEDRWFEPGVWKKLGRSYSAEDLQGQLCFAGLDVGQTTDLTAFSLLFPFKDGTFKTLTYYWLPEDNIVARNSATA